MALPKKHRLAHRRHFSKVYRFGKQRANRHFAVKVLMHSSAFSDDSPRFGITVSQKVSKRSVIRNRLRRQVRAAIQVLLCRITKPCWVVIVLRPPAIECDYWQFLRELEELFSELEVLNGH